jgi:hypothetical protein
MRNCKSTAAILGAILLTLALASCKPSCDIITPGTRSCSGSSGQTPVITSPAALGKAVEGSPFSVTLTSGGGTAPITWALVNGTALPAGLALNTATGVISGTLTLAVPVDGVAVPFDVQATDSAAHASTVQTANIIVFNYPVPTPDVGTLPNGIVNTAYTPTTIGIVGGHGPFTLTVTGTPTGMKVTAGSGTGGADITGVATVTGSVTLSGTPTVATASATMTVTIADTSNPSQQDIVTYKFQILSGPPTCPLVGPFAFLMQGFDSNGEFQVAGSVTVNSSGTVTAGAEDFKSTTATATNVGLTGTCSITGAIPNSGTLTLTLSSGSPNTRTYDFVMGANGFGHIQETDGLATATGPIQEQNATTFANFHGDFAFGFAGNDGTVSGNRLALAGAFCSNSSFQLTNFAIDMTSNGTAVPEAKSSSTSATYATPDGNGRTSFGAPLAVSSSPAVSLAMTFYVVTAGKAFAIETSPHASANPIVGGQVIRQAGINGCAETYSNASLNQSVIATRGASGGASYTTLAHVSGVAPASGNTTAGTAQLVIDQNAGGTVTLLNNNGGTPITANYTVELDGRVTFTYTTTDNKAHTAHAYFYQSSGDAFFVGSDLDSAIGSVRAQSQTTNIAVPAGIYSFGTVFTPTGAALQQIGLLSQIAGASFKAQTGITSVALTIAPDANFSTTGRATVVGNVPFLSGTHLVLYAINPTTLAAMGSDSVPIDNIGNFDQ